MIKQRPHIAGGEKVAVKVTTFAKDVATLVTNVSAGNALKMRNICVQGSVHILANILGEMATY